MEVCPFSRAKFPGVLLLYRHTAEGLALAGVFSASYIRLLLGGACVTFPSILELAEGICQSVNRIFIAATVLVGPLAARTSRPFDRITSAPGVFPDVTSDEDANPMSEAKYELEDDDMEVMDDEERLTYHKGKKRTIEEVEKSVIDSPDFAENTRRGSARFTVAVEKAVGCDPYPSPRTSMLTIMTRPQFMNAKNPTEGEPEVECYPSLPNKASPGLGLSFSRQF